MTLRNADLPTRAEVLERGSGFVSGTEWSILVPNDARIAYVYLSYQMILGLPLIRLDLKHRHIDCKRLTATDWQGMVREAIGILEGER